MFKKIKDYFSLQRRVQIEILETLCTICLWLERDGRYDRNPYSQYMGSHFKSLKNLSKEIRSKEWNSAIEDLSNERIKRFNKYIF